MDNLSVVLFSTYPPGVSNIINPTFLIHEILSMGINANQTLNTYIASTNNLLVTVPVD